MKRSPRLDRECVRCAAIASAALILWIAAPSCRGVTPPPATRSSEGTLAMRALSAPVTVLTDRFGIPHVRASNLPDLYFAWGWVTARDRLWQLALTRVQGRGLLHRWMGNAALRGDGGAQLFELHRRAVAIWGRDRSDPVLRMEVERYSEGIRARMAEVRAGQAPLPPELARLHQEPEDWRPDDTVMTLLGLGITLDLDLPELDEGREIREHGKLWLEDRHRFESQWMYDTIPDSAARHMWGSPPSRAPSAGREGTRLPLPLLTKAAECVAPWARDGDVGEERASNAMVVGPARSASGRALLANDPHLSLLTPGYLHFVHLSIPGEIEAIGAAVPGLPAIVSGRNLRCAWGVTALSADVADVYEDSLSSDGRRVWFEGRWVPVVQKPYDLRFRFLGISLPAFGQVRRYTPHGPVLAFDRKARRALSLRWSAFEDERISLRQLVGVERSASAGEIAARYRTLVTPGINLLTADVDGDVRYQTCGLVPKRMADPGRGLLPGDGLHEWPGFIPADSMPAWRVPAGGFAVNANNRPTPVFPYALPRYDWAHDRALRMAQRLSGDARVTAADLASIQGDVWSRAGARLVPALIACADSLAERLTPRMRAGLDTLRRWDGLARRSRVAPTIFRGWMGALQRRSQTEGLPGLTLAALTGRAGAAFREPGSERNERAAEAAVRALAMALDTLAAKLGPDLSSWTWARAHRAHFRHALAALDAANARAWEPEPIPVDGDGSTPCVGGSHLPWNTDVTHGPVFRHVVDLANRDYSYGVLPPGNTSGSTRLLARWADHGYVPLYLNWEHIKAVTAERVTLVPAGP